MKQIYMPIVLVFMILIVASCNNKGEIKNEYKNEKIVFTHEQFKAMGMKIDQPQPYTMHKIVRTNGFIKPSLTGSVTITAVIEGQVSGVKKTIGNNVEKGETLFMIGGSEVIALQNNYLKASANYEFAKQEFDRITQLVDEHIAARKDLLGAQNNFKLAKAEKQSLRTMLKMINLSLEKVEAGDIESAYPVVAPISGYLTGFNATNGQFVERQFEAAKIVNPRELKLELNVFEKDVQKLKPGQQVIFYSQYSDLEKCNATLSIIGQSIDQQTQTIICIADVENIGKLNFISGMYVECNVLTSSHFVNVLPSTALFTEGEQYYVLVKLGENNDAIEFDKVAVETGDVDGEFTEIKTLGLNNVLVNGAYYYQVSE